MTCTVERVGAARNRAACLIYGPGEARSRSSRARACHLDVSVAVDAEHFKAIRESRARCTLSYWTLKVLTVLFVSDIRFENEQNVNG